MTLLKDPLEHPKLSLRNRLVMPPMATAKSDADGKINTDILNYYDEKSKGGYLSLIIIEHSFISQEGKANYRQMSVADDSLIENLKKLSAVIHRNGAKTVMQINHAGSETKREITGFKPIGPSAVLNPAKPDSDMPEEMSKGKIIDLIEEFTDAALRVKKAGFDGVEIHSAHGYLLNQFLSPLTNKRLDEYGGDIMGRIKIHLDIIRGIRKTVGEEFPILLRLGASDYREGGLTVDDSKIAAQAFEKAGVDILDISGGMCRYENPENKHPGYFAPLSAAIKSVVSIPVIVTGGITKPDEAQEILKSEKADLVGIGRAVLKDSDWAKNVFKKL